MIRKQFRETYEDCIRQPYTTYSLKKPVVYCVDTIFHRNRIQSTRCDDFVLCDLSQDKAGIYLVEIKGRHFRVKKVVAQLQGGADFICGRLPSNQAFDFCPVLVAEQISRPSAEELKEETVSIRGEKKKIKFIIKHDELPSISENS